MNQFHGFFPLYFFKSKILIFLGNNQLFVYIFIGIEGREDLAAVEKLQARLEHRNVGGPG